jgi:TPR repeat protein
VEFLELAAVQDFVCAQVDLAYLYLEGAVVEQNVTKGLNWSVKAVQLNYSLAHASYGRRLLFGIGIPQNCEKGLHHLRLSVQQCDPLGCLSYARAYLYGIGVAKDTPVGLMYRVFNSPLSIPVSC